MHESFELLVSHTDEWCGRKSTARAPLTAKNVKQQHNHPMKNNTCKTVSCHVRLTVHKYGPEARLGPGLNWTGWWISRWWMDRQTGGYVGGMESREDQEQDRNRKAQTFTLKGRETHKESHEGLKAQNRPKRVEGQLWRICCFTARLRTFRFLCANNRHTHEIRSR